MSSHDLITHLHRQRDVQQRLALLHLHTPQSLLQQHFINSLQAREASGMVVQTGSQDLFTCFQAYPVGLGSCTATGQTKKKIKEQGQYDEFKRNDAKRKRFSRQKSKEKERKMHGYIRRKIVEERRKQTRERVAKHRASRKEQWEEQRQQRSEAFKRAQALGKAMTRAKRALEPSLPRTPKRKKAICHRLFRTLVGVTEPDPDPLPSTLKDSNTLSKETIVLVQTFYEREDISRQAPGRKDTVLVRGQDGIKQRIQVKHLTYSVMEVFALFTKEYPDVKIRKSKFASLRPLHVQLSNKLPHNVCLCKYHENFILAINALHTHCPNIPKYNSKLPEQLLSSPASRDCWFNRCENCKDGKVFMAMIDMDDEVAVTWYVWKNDSDERLSKVVEEGTTDDLRSYISSILAKFMEHCYIKREQAAAYKLEREAIEGSKNKALLQVDFSENYTCQYQDEIQSAHWQQHQVSLFTAAMWHTGVLHSIVIASDNIVHSKDTIIAYLDMLLEMIPNSVTSLLIWSDGPASQFKNRFIAAAMISLQKKHKINIHWNFFATSHGKGPVDGIGGAVKRYVWTAV